RQHKQLRSSDLDITHPEVKRLFFSNTTRYLNGYVVEAQTDYRSVPAPITWRQPKLYTSGTAITDGTSLSDNSDKKEDHETKSVTGFWVVKDNQAYETKIRRVINVHNNRNPVSGRPEG